MPKLDYAVENEKLRRRIQELEEIRHELKDHLGLLRHQKNKLLIKKNIHTIEVGSPFSASSMQKQQSEQMRQKEYEERTKILEEHFAQKEKLVQGEVGELSKKYDEELDKMKKENREFEAEMEALQSRQNELEGEEPRRESERHDRKQKLQKLREMIEKKNRQLDKLRLEKIRCNHGPVLEELHKRIEALERANADVRKATTIVKTKSDKAEASFLHKQQEWTRNEKLFKQKIDKTYSKVRKNNKRKYLVSVWELKESLLLMESMLKQQFEIDGDSPDEGGNGQKVENENTDKSVISQSMFTEESHVVDKVTLGDNGSADLRDREHTSTALPVVQ